MRYLLALCALLVSSSAFSEVLVARTNFAQSWWPNSWGNGFVLSYQLASVPVYASIGDQVLISESALQDQSYTWNVTSPTSLSYLQQGLQTTGDDFWFLEGPSVITLHLDSCVTGTSTECSYGGPYDLNPFFPDLSVNGKIDFATVNLARLEVKLGPASGPAGPWGPTREGTISLYADPVSQIPEPDNVVIFGLGFFVLAAVRAARKSQNA